MGNAHRGDHDIAFYEARIGRTDAVTTAGAATPVYLNDDAAGPLAPARYLIQLGPTSVAGVIVWVGFTPFEAGVPVATVTGAGPKRVPLGTGDGASAKLAAIETNVLEATDDRITIESLGGTATVYVTQISTLIPKGLRV